MKTILIIALFCTTSWAQIVLNGTAYNFKSGQPIAKANVIVLGTSDGSATDDSGYFQIETTKSLPIELVISHIAYNSKTITITNHNSITIRLEPAVITGDEISVIGKYSRAEQDVSTSIENVTLEEMEKIGASDVSDALRTISSTNIEQVGGGRQTISIRGSNPNEVSVYLDGIRLNDAYTNTANIAAIDQNDLSSIEVIKGSNTTLFSNGNFGGVVFLNTQLPDSAEIKFARGVGLKDDNNKDLSFSAAGRLGQLTFGGRYSGKARRYHGRTTYTTIFNNVAMSQIFTSGKIDAKAYNLEDYLTLPTESVVQSAKTQLGMVRYHGNIASTENWELYTSAKIWNWDDDFFSNLSRKIDDKIFSARVGKGINSKNIKSIFNIEFINQEYVANNKRIPPESIINLTDYHESIEIGELVRTNPNISSVVQINSPIRLTEEQHLLWEFGFRIDNFNTKHNQSNSYRENLFIDLIETEAIDTTFSNNIFGFRAGVSTAGKTNFYNYKLFLNQGRSSRLPTLNDIYLSYNRSDSFNLNQEKLYSTELGFEINNLSQELPSKIRAFSVFGGLFVNNYDNKIAYQFREDAPPIPYNIDLTKISGFDIGFSLSAFDDIFRFNVGYQKLNIDNPIVFPNKPNSKLTIHAEIGNKLVSLGYDYYKEGPQFIIYNGFLGNSLAGRENTNISLILKPHIWKLNFVIQYVIHNVFSDEPVIADPDVHYLSPFNFFDVHRQLLTVKFEI